jgi:uncharacterized protein YbcI
MRLCKVLLALGVLSLLSVPALAQQPGGGRGRGGFGGPTLATLAQNKSVQDELKVSTDDATKLKDALAKVNEDLKDDIAKLGGGRGGRGGGGGGGNNVTPEERTAARKKVNEAQLKAIKSVLNDKQMTRLEQVYHQQQGINVFTDEDVAKGLKLTDDQKTKIKEISDNLAKDRRDLLGAGGGGGGGGRGRGAITPENQQKLTAMTKDAMSNAEKTLTDDQKKELKSVLGEPFDGYKPDAGGRGGRGGQNPAKPRTDF